MFISPMINWMVSKTDLLEVGTMRSSFEHQFRFNSVVVNENVIIDLIDKKTYKPYVQLIMNVLEEEHQQLEVARCKIRTCIIKYFSTNEEEVIYEQNIYELLSDILATYCKENNIPQEEGSTDYLEHSVGMRYYSTERLFKEF